MQDYDLEADFFVLRSPYLPFDRILEWSTDLTAIGSLQDSNQLKVALERDRQKLRSSLLAFVNRPEILESIYVASPDLIDSLPICIEQPQTKRGGRIELALVRYFLRMAARPTPFGLFAGCSVGRITDKTSLKTEGKISFRRHTRLDMDYLFSLTEALSKDPEIRKSLVYRSNTTIYLCGESIRYQEARLNDKVRSYHLVAADFDDALQTVLDLAEGGATISTLVESLISEDVTEQEAAAYINDVIDSQILVPDFGFYLTGAGPMVALMQQMENIPACHGAVNVLKQIAGELEDIDRSGYGNHPDRYRSIAKTLESLPAAVKTDHLFQVDMAKLFPASGVTLGKNVFDELLHATDLLHKIAIKPKTDLERFRDAFLNRYEMKEVPLLDALDEELGIGFPPQTATSTAEPLLREFAFPQIEDEQVRWNHRDKHLLRKLTEVWSRGSEEMVLDDSDFTEMATKNPPPLPGASSIMAVLAATSHDAIEKGDFRLHIHGIDGPSGARMLARFCHLDPELTELVKEHLKKEEARDPDAIFAEIVHLPQGRLGNILFRPLLRSYEIPYLGRSHLPEQQQIPVADLRVSVANGKIVLRSERMNRRVIPRLTTAHNFRYASLGIYYFLCALQQQGIIPGLGWSWGAFASADFLPRVRTGKLILSLAQWKIGKAEFQKVAALKGTEQFLQLQTWRALRKIPRFVGVQQSDNVLLIDFENVLAVECFMHLMKTLDEAVLVELFPPPDELVVSSPEGRFTHELLVPLIRTDKTKEQAAETTAPIRVSVDSSIERSFIPGSEWLYAKFYTGTATADQLLQRLLRPIVEQVMKSRLADCWFFLRYGDPEWHLRVRFHGDAQALQQKVFPLLIAAATPFLQEGQCWKIQLDTYEREVERYGGPQSMVLCEQLFQADSEAVLQLLDLLQVEGSPDLRWRYVMLGIDHLLSDFSVSAEERCSVLKSIKENFAMEFHVDKAFRTQLADQFRKERKNLESILSNEKEEENLLTQVRQIFQTRSGQISPIAVKLRSLESDALLLLKITELLPSFIHMHVNRMLRTSQREYEVVLYDFLFNLYQSQYVRNRSQSSTSL